MAAVLHKLVVASNHGAYVDCLLEDADFLPMAPKVGSGGWHFLNQVRRGYEINWSDRCVLPEQANCMLSALGLLHMRVRGMIPEEWGGNYMDEVSATCVCAVCCR